MSTGKPMSRREEWLEFWERREAPFLRLLPYVLLVLCVGFDIATRHGVDSAMRIDFAVSAALVIRQPLYGFYTWTGYFWAWRLFVGRGRFVGVALAAAVTAVSQT